MPTSELDRTDRAILNALQRDGRLSNVQLAAHVNLSESACLRRVKLLEEAGVIERYVMLVSQSAVGLPDNVFVEISLNREKQEDLDAFEDAVRRLPEVMEHGRLRAHAPRTAYAPARRRARTFQLRAAHGDQDDRTAHSLNLGVTCDETPQCDWGPACFCVSVLPASGSSSEYSSAVSPAVWKIWPPLQVMYMSPWLLAIRTRFARRKPEPISRSDISRLDLGINEPCSRYREGACTSATRSFAFLTVRSPTGAPQL